jgi:AcrR family transcriptional regulator
MSTAHHRPKNPAAIREALLSAAVSLLAEGSPISIGAIADAAGVTKGAVQHHFGTREQLLMALSEAMISDFQALISKQITDAEPAAGAHARAYLHVVFHTSDKDVQQAKAILAGATMERSVAHAWKNWMAQARRTEQGSDDHQIGMLICRLAADGLWLSDTLSTYDIDDATRTKLLQKLESMTYPG